MLLPIASTPVRLSFRVFFTLLFLYLGVIGSQAYKLSTKLRLLNNGRVRVVEAAGWLQATAVLDPLWRARTIPNIRWWTLMAVIAAFSKVTDLATQTVRRELLQSSCEFGTGLVITPSAEDTFSVPPWNGRSAFVAGNAQIRSTDNQCDQGIFWKVNIDSTFCAAEADIIGTWNCESVGEDTTYAYGNWTVDTIDDDLASRGLLYGSNISRELTQTSNPYDFTHLVVWSSSETDDSEQAFDVKASIDTTGHDTDDHIMHSMHCTMDAPDANTIASGIPSVNTLLAWVPLLQGYMYYGAGTVSVENPELWLAWYLNTMIMVAGGSDYLLATAPLSHEKQGCVVSTTVVPDWLIALLFLTVLACIVMTGVAVILYLRLRVKRNRGQVAHAPVDLWSWMAQAIVETDGADKVVKSKDLRYRSVELRDGINARIAGRNQELQPLSGH